MELPVKVSVVIVTYNHEHYISDAIKSILAQNVNFGIDIIIADDGSTDDTAKIAEGFSKQYPEKIISLKSPENKGVYGNAFAAKYRVRGEYVAILDGDDYWDYDLKLQKQVEFLDEHKDYNGIFHDAKIIHLGNAENLLFTQKYLYSQNYRFPEIIYPTDLIERELILPSSSALLRMNTIRDNDLKLINGNFSFLWKLTCLMIKNSKFRFINQPWSVYRNHGQGISKSNNYEFRLSHIQFLKNLLNDDFYKNHKYEVYRSIVSEYKLLLDSQNEYIAANKNSIFRKYMQNELLKIIHYRKKLYGIK